LLLGDKRTRQAIIQALDRDAIRVVFPGAILSNSFVVRGDLGFHDKLKTWPRNVDTASVVIATDKADVDYEVDGQKGTVTAGKSVEVAVRSGKTVKVIAKGDTKVTLTFLDEAKNEVRKVEKSLKGGESHSEIAPLGGAKKLLAELGWKPGPGGVLTRKTADGRDVFFRLPHVTTPATFRVRTQELLQRQLRDVGIELVPSNQPASVLFSTEFVSGSNCNWQGIIEFASAGGIGEVPADELSGELWADDPDTPAPFDNIPRAANGFAGSNVTGWANAEYDKLHFQALSQLDASARAETIKKMQEIFNDELPFIPLYERVEILAMKKGLVNYTKGTPLTRTPMWNAWLWGWAQNGAVPVPGFRYVDIDNDKEVEIIVEDPTLSAGQTRTADVDGDRDVDVVWVGTKDGGSLKDPEDIDGDKEQEAIVEDPTLPAGQTRTADVDGDRDVDVVWVGTKK